MTPTNHPQPTDPSLVQRIKIHRIGGDRNQNLGKPRHPEFPVQLRKSESTRNFSIHHVISIPDIPGTASFFISAKDVLLINPRTEPELWETIHIAQDIRLTC
jgi:hypothetical protein